MTSLNSFVDRLRQPSQWLIEQQWAQWCLIAVAACMLFLVLLKILRRLRRQIAGVGHMDNFNEFTLPGEVTYARHMDRANLAGRDSRRKIRTDPTELVAHPEISIRQLRREIFKRDQVEARLERQIDELKSANEQLRRKIAESKQNYADFEQKIAELTAVNEQLAAGQKKAKAEVEPESKEILLKDEVQPVAVEQPVKQCRKCEKQKPLNEFHKNASSHDGLARWCKACKTKAAKESREKRASARRAAGQQAGMCADAPLCVLHHRQTDRLKNARRHAGHATNKIAGTMQREHRSHRFRSQLSSPGLRCPRRQKQREQSK